MHFLPAHFCCNIYIYVGDVLYNVFAESFQQTRFHVSHSLEYKNGYAIRRRPVVTVGGMPLPFNNLSERELEALANFKPTLTYGQVKQAPPEDFIPAQVAWDKKVMINYYF